MTLIRFIKILRIDSVLEGRKFFLKEFWINPDWIIEVEEDNSYQEFLREEGYFPPELSKETEFTKITYSLGDYTATAIVIGPVQEIQKKIMNNNGVVKTLLKG